MQRIACSAPGESPSGSAEAWVARGEISGAAIAGGRRRMASASGSIATMQNTPTPMYVWRQPTRSKKCWSTGGQTAPAR